MMKHVFKLSLLITLCLSVFAQAEIYKWRDKDGTMRYTDTPPPSNIKLLGRIGYKGTTGPVSSTSPPEVKNEAPPPKEMAAPNKFGVDKKITNQQTSEEIEAQKKQQAELAKLKAANCSAAKANYQTYIQGGRIYRTNEKGEREVLGDEQIQQAVAQAQQEINENC